MHALMRITQPLYHWRYSKGLSSVLVLNDTHTTGFYA